MHMVLYLSMTVAEANKTTACEETSREDVDVVPRQGLG